MKTEGLTPELEIDALGLLCPLPVLRLRKRVKGMAPGAVVRVLADDPAAQIDIPHYCQEAGHVFLGAEPLAGQGADADRLPQAYLLRLG